MVSLALRASVVATLCVQKSALVTSRSAEGGKPMMDGFDTMRALACWGRPALLDDPQCMSWLSDHCADGTSGVEICSAFRDLVKEKCEKSNSVSACESAKSMGLDITTTTEPMEETAQESTSEEPKERDQETATTTTDQKKEEVDETNGAKDENEGSKPPAEDVDTEDRSAEKPKDRSVEKHDSSEPAKVEDEAAVEENAAEVAEKLAESAREEAEAEVVGPSPMAAPAASPVSDVPRPHFESAAMDKTMPEGGLPEQGNDEHSKVWVMHEDAKTATSDWGHEWPQVDESEGRSKEDICQDYPSNPWCKMFLAHREKQAARTSTEAPGFFGAFR